VPGIQASGTRPATLSDCGRPSPDRFVAFVLFYGASLACEISAVRRILRKYLSRKGKISGDLTTDHPKSAER
jgi:hypothetical protein